MDRQMPQVTKDLGFDFWWDTQKLWTVDLPIEEIELKELEWMFELPLWELDGNQVSLKPIEVKQNPTKYSEQYARTLNTDLSYPINVIFLKNKWVVMDGLHRVLKAHLQGQKTIKAKKAYKKHIPLIS